MANKICILRQTSFLDPPFVEQVYRILIYPLHKYDCAVVATTDNGVKRVTKSCIGVRCFRCSCDGSNVPFTTRRLR